MVWLSLKPVFAEVPVSNKPRSRVWVREVASRGNGLIDDWDRDGFEHDLENGTGGIWLRLSDQQYLALGGVL